MIHTCQFKPSIHHDQPCCSFEAGHSTAQEVRDGKLNDKLFNANGGRELVHGRMTVLGLTMMIYPVVPFNHIVSFNRYPLRSPEPSRKGETSIR